MPHPVSIRAAAATSRVPITMQRTFTRARYAPLPRRRRLAQPIPTRNPLLVPAGSVCRLPSPPLGGVAAAKHPLQAVNHRSPRIAAVIDAKWTLDEDNYYLNLTDPTSSDGESVMADRIAFAPTAKSPNEIVVSFYWHETEDSDDYYKYGNYYMFCERQ